MDARELGEHNHRLMKEAFPSFSGSMYPFVPGWWMYTRQAAP